MDKFIKNLLPRLKQFGQRLDKIESFVDKTWIKYDPTSFTIQSFRFKRNGELLISTNGIVEICEWDYLPPDSLCFKIGQQGIMYRHGFFLEALFMMQIEGANEEPILFYNESLIPDGNIDKYLKKLYAQKHNLKSFYVDDKLYHHSTGYGSGMLQTGVLVLDENLEPVNNLTIRYNRHTVYVEDGHVAAIRCFQFFDTEIGNLKFERRGNLFEGYPMVRDYVTDLNGNYVNGQIKIFGCEKLESIHIEKGRVKKLVYAKSKTTITIIFIGVFLLISYIGSVIYIENDKRNSNQVTKPEIKLPVTNPSISVQQTTTPQNQVVADTAINGDAFLKSVDEPAMADTTKPGETETNNIPSQTSDNLTEINNPDTEIRESYDFRSMFGFSEYISEEDYKNRNSTEDWNVILRKLKEVASSSPSILSGYQNAIQQVYGDRIIVKYDESNYMLSEFIAKLLEGDITNIYVKSVSATTFGKKIEATSYL
jgi:hypothetical protein